MTTTLYKLGGSLLSLVDLGARLERLLAMQPDERVLFVVGGGEAVELVREWDRRHQLGDERSHQLALQAMMLNEAFLVELLPHARLVTNRQEAMAVWKAGQAAILCAYEFLRNEEETNDPLPCSWDVTSDSIAAWVSLHWPADRLVLLKSTSLSPGDPTDRLQPVVGNPTVQLVDPYFHQIRPRLTEVGWVNLRAQEPAIQTSQ